MDMVIDETLRLYPPALRTDRVCSSDYFYKNMKFDKGAVVAISIYALQHNPEIYPDPDRFDP
jgi:cytochrome P450